MNNWHEIMNNIKVEFEKLEAYIENQVAKEMKQIDLLRRIDREIIHASSDLDNVFVVLMKGALELTGSKSGQLLITAGNQLEIVWSTQKTDIGKAVELNDSVSGEAVLRKKPKNVPDVDKEPLYQRILPDMKSELAVPMKDDKDVVLGVINLENPKLEAFKDPEELLVKTLAAQGALAIRNAQRFQERKAAVEIQNKILSQTLKLNEALGEIAKQVQKLVASENCQILLFHNNRLIIAYTTGNEEPGTLVDVNNSVSGKAVLRKKPKNVPDVDKEPLYQRILPGMKSELAVPILAKDEVLGVINMESPHLNHFQKHDEYLVQLFANSAAVAINNVRILQQIIEGERYQTNIATRALMGDAAGNAIHRLNNLVGAIRACVGEIRSKYSKDLESENFHFLKERLDDIYKNSELALAIPENLRTKITGAAEKESLNMNQVIPKIIDSMKPNNIKLKADYQEDLPDVITHRQIEEVVRNLVKNAIEAMPEGGTLTAVTRIWRDRVSQSDKGVEFRIKDTGIGIPKEVIHKVFDYDFSTKSSGRGLGYGLWWVKMFLDGIGGEVLPPESVPGKETTFHVRLPFQSK